MEEEKRLTELNIACKEGELAQVRYCVEVLRININQQDRWNATPLYYACLCGHIEVECIYPTGARCEENTFDGERCFHGALTLDIKNLLSEYKVAIRYNPFVDFLKRSLNNASEMYSDFTIEIKQIDSSGQVSWVSFPVHRCILASRCDYFDREFFRGKWAGKEKARLVNTQIEPLAFLAVIRYLYLGYFEIQKDLLPNCQLISKRCGLDQLTNAIQSSSNLSSKSDWFFFTPPPLVGKSLERDLRKIVKKIIHLSSQSIKPPEEERLGSDVCFEVEGKLFWCHKVFLCGRSEYFSALLGGKFRESQSDQAIELVGISAAIFSIVLEYLYTDRLEEVHPLLLVDTLTVADLLLIDGLKQYCIAQLTLQVDETNVFEIFRLGRMFSVSRLEDHCVQAIALHLDRLIESPELSEIIRESALEIKERQETDSIPIVDEIRTYIDQTFGAKDEDFLWYDTDTIVAKERESQRRLMMLEDLLATLGYEA